MNSNTFYKTFSGTDAVAFMLLPDASPILLGSVTTISYSMYRDKKPVTLIGKINVSGYTRGMRVIAGSLVFTMINQHIVKDISLQVPYLQEHNKIKADELPIFDIMIVSANEYGKATRMMIYGIDITDDSQVVSIQDLFVENTFNFVARDIDEFTAYKDGSMSNSRSTYNNIDTYTSNTVHGFDMINYNKDYKVLSHDLFNLVQKQLHDIGRIEKLTGTFDNETYIAIKKIQKEFNLPITGCLDESTYKAIFSCNKESDEKLYIVTNLNGAILYSDQEFFRKSHYIPYMERIFCKHINNHMITTVNGYDLYLKKDDVIISKDFDNKVTPISSCGSIAASISDFPKIGITVNQSCNIKATCISEYNDKKKVTSKIYNNLSIGSVCSLYDITDAYIYDIEMQSFPTKIMYIIKVDDNFYKWVVTINE